MRARSVAACLKDQIPADIPYHYARVQGSTIKAADCVDRTERMQGIGWLCGLHCWVCLCLDCHDFRMPMQLHTLCVLHTTSSFPPIDSCLQLSDSRCSAARRGSTARQHGIGPSWASNDVPSKDLSNTRAMQHLAPLTTDYWAASHSFIEPRIVALAGIFKR